MTDGSTVYAPAGNPGLIGDFAATVPGVAAMTLPGGATTFSPDGGFAYCDIYLYCGPANVVPSPFTTAADAYFGGSPLGIGRDSSTGNIWILTADRAYGTPDGWPLFTGSMPGNVTIYNPGANTYTDLGIDLHANQGNGGDPNYSPAYLPITVVIG